VSFCQENASRFEMAKQVIRSAGSVGANYRASARVKSTADFIYKIENRKKKRDNSGT